MEFVRVRAYDNYVYANMQLGMLQADGITCYLKDEYTVTIDPLLSPALGGIKLMVQESQLTQAEALLKEVEDRYKSDSA
jgi:hypothetical protein